VVHEAYLLLGEAEGVRWQDRQHFFSFMARLMRRALVHHARAKGAQKRGGDEVRVTLGDDAAVIAASGVDVLDLDRALDELQALDARQARVVELRFFAGLSVQEVSAELSLAPATVKRDWSTARAWLAHRLMAS
jgi:RNA polymerase sigma factor (TIGR02999 family)